MQYKVNLKLVTKENALLAPEIYYNTALSSKTKLILIIA